MEHRLHVWPKRAGFHSSPGNERQRGGLVFHSVQIRFLSERSTILFATLAVLQNSLYVKGLQCHIRSETNASRGTVQSRLLLPDYHVYICLCETLQYLSVR